MSANEPKYALVSDEPERQRLDSQHEQIKSIFNGKLLPDNLILKDGDRVLDAGTGTGVWALDIATLIPKTVEIDCIDITRRLFPASPPVNLHFSVGNILTLPASSAYTLVHQRFLTAAFSGSDWKTCLKNLYGALRPGGWLKMEELRALVLPDTLPNMERMLQFASAVEKGRDIDFAAVDHLEGWIKEAGFQEVQAEAQRWWLGPGEQGADNRAIIMEGWRAVRRGMKSFGNDLGMSDEEWNGFIHDIEKELAENESWLTVHSFTACKPYS
ncbi:S-adenosyl-L-methionine-dependent methyltransferase [Calocera viscosa TUFC12733]|uniref:S-adenosyl-L-methionine-dependent methyltransferase n=1 Tax=Calocera viscosa (strain TUFC12733) TaxID=1330018 RepID=A0A167G975_CALVF|nr:S-adenosyl-L-methionine-dependent methyltransferase [Calocera viscosa TUFC12733]